MALLEALAGDYALQGFGPLWVGQGGVVLILTAVLGGIVLYSSRASRDRLAIALPPFLLMVGVAVLIELVLTTWYLFAPGYMDHIEASVASDVHYFRAGIPLYPPTDSYTFHGLLYGPLLVELNSLGYVVPAGAFSAKVVGWAAAWIAIAVIVVSTRFRAAGGWGGLAGIAYALCLLVAFGGELTTDRSESLLLLDAALALAIARYGSGLSRIVALSVLTGAASAFKLHGPLYCLPALFLWCAELPGGQRWRWRTYVAPLTVFAAVAAVAAALPFLPANVSLDGYREYLGLALKHGASLRLFLLNVAFLLGIWAPLVVLVGGVARARRLSAESRWFALVLFGAECLVVVVASKPGAGVHHMLPFLAAHAYIFQRLYVELRQTDGAAMDSAAVVAVAATVIGMVFPILHTSGQLLAFDRQAREQTLQRDELLRFAGQYPHGMLGVAGYESYMLVNFRPWLTLHGTLQTDYGAFMDLRLSGLDDMPLQRAFGRCDIPFVYMPKPGTPFTVPNAYGGPLFSDDLRSRFAARYSLVAHGTYFDVYGCSGTLHAGVPPVSGTP